MHSPGERFRTAVEDLLDLAVLNYTRDGFLAEIAFLLDGDLAQVGGLLALPDLDTAPQRAIALPSGVRRVPAPLRDAGLGTWARDLGGEALLYLGTEAGSAGYSDLLLVSGAWLRRDRPAALLCSRSAWGHLHTAPPEPALVAATVEAATERWLASSLAPALR